ncbi:HVO_0234 family beta-propeller protein [Haloglomus litoreum]|uniref:HVO_0234 family beta-propeller protein n=1 Tax=Haloglomus litoreum TaxID=3034026 RepID=UPI0023E7A744|nr:hypothetical protein [Haloglomus sp. DT116]
MSDDDISIDEKRVYGAKTGTTAAFVATGAGLARVEISGDLVGEFGLAHRGGVHDVAGHDGRLAVAADDDVRLGIGDIFRPTGFGTATAVGWHDGTLHAAGDGRVARFDPDGDPAVGDLDDPAPGTWTTAFEVGDVRAIVDDTVAAADGLFRLDGGHIGLADARDVAPSVPLAATGDGLYYLGNGWMDALPGDFRAVVAAPDGRAHAATPDALYARAPGSDGYGPEAWVEVDLPVTGHVVDVAYGPEATYAVTAEGTVLVNAGDGWRDRSLGLPDARRLAVPGVTL